jgi:RecQ family ATP-dependent DNA helicase
MDNLGGSYHKAGYYLEYLQNLREEIENSSGLNLQWAIDRLCTFRANTVNYQKVERHAPPEDWRQILSVCHNLLVRGVPTYPTLNIEKILLRSTSKIVPITEVDDSQSYSFRDGLSGILREAWIAVLARAHVALDSMLVTPPEKLDSPEETSFLNALLRELGPSVYQLVESQRRFDTILQSEEATKFYDQRVDFALDTGSTRVIVEIDGKQHEEPAQAALDQRRDRFLKSNCWEVIRIPASDVRQNRIDPVIQTTAQSFRRDPFLILAARNCAQPLEANDTGRAALRLVLTPFAIARIQWSIVWAFLNGLLDIQKRTLKIAVIEWDLPCASMAVSDLVATVRHLLALTDIRKDLPGIDLDIFCQSNRPASDDGMYALEDPSVRVRMSEADRFERLRKEHFDLIVSVSTLRVGPQDLRGLVGQNVCIAVHSVYSPRGEEPRIESAYPIRYRLNSKMTQPPEDLVYFLRWIFRKRKFRDGQFEMLRRSLSLEDLIGLLPTSGGKSLCYQLSALLQPGTTLIVDPIISLMLDQTDNLRQLQISATGLVSSDLNREEQNKELSRLMQRSLVMFFISPERLQIPSFRKTLEILCQTTPVPYLTIDEAHCISEWGHDFRPSYLRLVDNGKKCCKYAGSFQPRLIALTGTASSVVLSDIQRVINLSDEALVTPESFDRPELVFEVARCSSLQKWQTLKMKMLELPSLFNQPSELFFATQNGGIIFCPWVNGTYGIAEVATRVKNELRNQLPDARMFSGKPPRQYAGRGMEWRKDKTKNQKDFKANKAALVVATKAFGMGIDKPNIRYIIHYAMPTSLEAYYQEAGRAGRDGAKAVCTLLYSGDTSRWQRVLSPNATVENSKGEPTRAGEQDDIGRMLWFHSKTWPGIDEEYGAIRKLLVSDIYPPIMSLGCGDTTLVKIPFGGEIENDEEGDSRTRLEKMPYRLCILGLVTDYGLDHKARMFEVEVVRQNDESVKSILLEYIRRYRPVEFVDAFAKQIDEAEGSTMVERCLRKLIEFVYDEIEKKRRRMILNMAEAAESPDGSTFRMRIINYLETSEFTKKLGKISLEMVPQEWIEIAVGIEDVSSAQRLADGCRRVLESFPDHPGLLLLSAYARMFTSDSTALDEFRRAAQALARSPLEASVREQTLARMIEQMALDRPSAVPALCQMALQEFPQREIARVTLRYTEAATPVGELALRILLTYMVGRIREVRKHICLGGERF